MHGQQPMSGLRAEMRDVDNRGGVGGGQAQHLARLQGLQPLACAQHGQGAQQSRSIVIIIKIHIAQLPQRRTQVHAEYDLTPQRTTTRV